MHRTLKNTVILTHTQHPASVRILALTHCSLSLSERAGYIEYTICSSSLSGPSAGTAAHLGVRPSCVCACV